MSYVDSLMEGSCDEQGGDYSLADDWRTQHEPDLREMVTFAVVERLKICFHHELGENDIKNTAIKFEEEIYGMATDKDDYLWKISRKVHGIHRNFIIVSSDNGANTTTPDPGKNLNTSGGDWREETYQKIKDLKEKHVLVLNTLFQTISDKLREIDSLPQQKKFYERCQRLRLGKAMVEQVLGFLNVCESSVSEFHRDRFSRYEAKVVRLAEFHQKVTRWKMQLQQPQTKHQQLPKPMASKAIQSSTPESLAESVSEMSSIISFTDRFAGSVQSIRGTRACLEEDSSERTRFRLQQGTNKRFKRSVTAIPLDSKVNKIEPSYALLQEITEINGRLVETVLVCICNEDVCSSEVTSGTVVVTCSYVPVALCATFKALYNSGHISQIQPLRLLVPESYPSSPILLEGVLFDTASVHKHEDLSARARTRFGLSMKEYSEPMSLKEIAQAWDECARANSA